MNRLTTHEQNVSTVSSINCDHCWHLH